MNPKVKAKWTSNDVAWGTKSLYYLYEENQEEKDSKTVNSDSYSPRKYKRKK